MTLNANPIHCDMTSASLETALRPFADCGAGVIALVPEAGQTGIALLQDCCRRLNLGLAGAVFPALVVGGREVQDGVVLLRFAVMPPTLLITDADDPLREDELADHVRGWVGQQRHEGQPVLFTLFDACLPNMYSLLRKIGAALEDEVSYGGVNAGSESFQPMACLFDLDRLVGDGVLLVLLPELARSAVAHGFDLPVRIMRANATERNRILQLEGRPAFEMYREAIRDDYGLVLSDADFYEHAVHYPLAILAEDSLVQIRIPVGLDSSGGLYCVGDVPQGALVVIVKAPRAEESDCLEQLADQLERHAAGLALLTFYCAGRRLHMGPEQSRAELLALQQKTGAQWLVGAFSLGEIATDGRGAPAFHNAALLCQVLQSS